MTLLCRAALLLVLAALVCKTKTETQWANENNNAEEEEKKVLNAVTNNASTEDSPSPEEDDESDEGVTPTEMQLAALNPNYQNAESNLSHFGRLEINKFASDASPENTLDQNVKSEVSVNRVESEPELGTTTLPFDSVTENTHSFADSITVTDTTANVNGHEALKVTGAPFDSDASLRDLNVFANADDDRKVTSGFMVNAQPPTENPKSNEKPLTIGVGDKVTAEDSTNAETTEKSIHDESTTERTDCISGDEKCKHLHVVPTGGVISRLKDKVPFWVANSTSSLFPSVWNTAKATKPVAGLGEDLNTSTSVKILPDRTTPLFFETSTAQTSENLIVVEGSVGGKDESAQSNYLNKNDKAKQMMKPNESLVNLTEDRPIRNFPKLMSTTPISDPGKQHDSNGTFTTKVLEPKNADPGLSTQPNTRVWTVSPHQNASHIHDINDKMMEIDSAVVFPKPMHEIYSPNSDLFTTASWYGGKGSYTRPDDEITKNYEPEMKQVTPLLFPSFRETTTEKAEVPKTSKSLTVKGSEDLVPVVTTTSFVSHTPALQPEISTYFPSKGDVGTTPQEEEEYAPPPRLTNPDCAHLPVCLELTLRRTGWRDFCSRLPDVRALLAAAVSEYVRRVHPHQVALGCAEPAAGDAPVSAGFYVTDDSGEYDERLTEICGLILRKWAPASFGDSVVEVKFYSGALQSTPVPGIPELNSGFVAAVAVSAVAGVALCLLCVLLVVMKQKLLQGRNSETTSPSADAYSLDSLSINASFRRRRTRRSARSYLNHAFNDQEIPSHPLNEKFLMSCLKNRDTLEAEFKKIPMNMTKLDQIPEGAHVKNRYSNILPNPETRVVLADKSGDPLKSYINANFVKGYEGNAAAYIACQAPLPDGVEDFWRMVWEQQSRVIVMLTLFEENGNSRCATYFPQSTLVAHPPCGDFQVSLLKKEVYEFYTVSTLRLLDMEKNLFRDIVHLWYTSWPDVGVPKDPSGFVFFMQQCRPFLNCNSGPTLVHCSTGTGRTGVFLAVDICTREYDQSRSVDVLQCVSQLRRDRGGAVQNKDQYLFVHEALLEYISCAANQSQRPSIQSLNNS